MESNKYIQKFLCERRTFCLFQLSAIYVIPLTFFVFFMQMEWVVPYVSELERSFLFQILMAIVWIPLVIGGMAIVFGMLLYLFYIDHHSWKIPWLALFLCTGWVGASVYFWSVYRGQVLLLEEAKGDYSLLKRVELIHKLLYSRYAYFLMQITSILSIPITAAFVYTIIYSTPYLIEIIINISFVFCGVILWFGMVAHLLILSKGSWKFGWLLLFFAGGLVTAAAYFQTAYKKDFLK